MEPSSRIFIKGLPPNIKEAELRKHFSAGNREITDVKLIPQRRIGYVGYKTAEDAAKAVRYFNKSYVRMSKILVESAKPISDPSLSKQHHGHAHPAASSAKRKSPDESAEDDAVSKKRRANESDPSDPKLREFLKVMGSSKEGVLEDATAAAGQGQTLPDVPQVAAPEDESDDEYEEIPSRKDVERKAVPSSRAQPGKKETSGDVESQAEQATHQPTAAADQEEAEPTGKDESGGGAGSEPADDDNWLRSRTNRLLDLMDPEDLPAEPKGGSIKKPQPEQKDTAKPAKEEPSPQTANDTSPDAMEVDETANASTEDQIRRTSRLFVRNLPYGATDDDIRAKFEEFGILEEVHLPESKSGNSKGFALVLFADPSNAVDAFQSMDGATFQGRILHIIPGGHKRDTGLDEFEISKLPLKKQNLIRKRAEASSKTFNWNSLYMNQDAVNTSVANRLGVTKSELLDPTSADAAVKQAIAETTVIGDTKAYFAANGVDLDAFKSHKRGDTAILVKNFPYGTTIDELRTLFEESGPVLKVLMPPSGTIAIVQFTQANHAKTAFGKLAYRRIKDSVLFLEKAPKDLFRGGESAAAAAASQVSELKDRPTGAQKINASELLSGGDRTAEDVVDTTSLFVRNLNFDTTTARLAEAFNSLDGFVSAKVKTKKDPKKPGQTLSMGFGFVEFRSKGQAQEALKTMDGYVLDGHTLAVKASHKGLDAAEERRREDKARKEAGQRTKIIIKNLPFQASKKDIRALFGTYGQLRSVRVPKKADYTARGFAFADFVTPREAENALNSLRDTHLLGRKLVLDFAEAEAADAEEEIEKMQRKVGGQVNKMALQQLTGKGRQKVNIADEQDEFEG